MVEAEGRLFKIGVFEIDDYWFPLKSGHNNTDQEYSDSDMDEDDEDGISDTVCGDENNNGNNILDDDESPCDGDVNNTLEEGEIPGDMDDVEVVMESEFDTGNEQGNRTVTINSGDISDNLNEPTKNTDGPHGNIQRTAEAIPIINEVGVNYDSINGHFIPHPRGSNCQPDENTLEVNSHMFGPGVTGAQIGETTSTLGARVGNFTPFVFQSDPGPKLNFSMGCGPNGKRRRVPSPIHAFSNKKTHTILETSTPNTQQNLEPSQSPSIDLNRCIPHSNSLGSGVAENSPTESVNELTRTVEIGQAVGFQIDEGNEALAEILGESGDLNRNQ
ncbi:hypothetical protein L1887_23573 [Cichorium endivia]|nr:hypothetical protein L1887_23573 [Cichorium endivia]